MTDILLMLRRSLITSFRVPAAILPNVFISIFFLFVYQAGLSPVANLPGFHGSYLGFILPVAIVSAAVGGAGSAGQALIRDLEAGYFTKLLLTPTRRLAIIWGPMIAGAIILVGQVLLIMVLAVAMGLRPASGPLGLLVVVAFAFLWGMAFAGYAVFIALRTKNAAAAQAATFVFFPLIFLSSTFVPLEFIETRWLKVAATVNPTTYVFDAMRSLLLDGWSLRPLALGLVVALGFATLTGALALHEARRATRLGA